MKTVGAISPPRSYKGGKSNYRPNPHFESTSGKGKGKNIRPHAPQDEEFVQVERPALPAAFSTSESCYDSKELHGLTFNEKVEASHWSRKRALAGRDVFDVRAHELMYHGSSKWSLRILSHERLISTVPTRSVAESVFVAHLLALVRKHHLDLDGAAENAWVQQNPHTALPSKTSDIGALCYPILAQLLQVLQKYALLETSSKVSQEMIALKTRLAKREEQLRAQGVELSPAKPALSSEEPATGSGHSLPLQSSGPPAIEEQPQPGALEHLDNIDQGILKTRVKRLTGPSVEASQSWLKGFKKTLGNQKFEELQNLAEEIYKTSSDKASSLSKDRLKELSVKFGTPMSIANRMGIKSLSAVMATATMLAA